MTKKHLKKIAGLLAAICLLSGCSGKEAPVPPQGSVNDSTGAYRPTVPDVSEQLVKAKQENQEVVGWLMMPNTTIDEPVVQTSNNDYYLRRDYKGNQAFEGCYYMDYESIMFDEGADLAQNTIIYGHNLGSPMGVRDDPDGVKFAQLFKLQDEDTARKTPYIYLVTPAKTHIFEIFAVFYCEERLSPVPYHLASYSEERLMQLVNDVKNRSTFIYDVPVDGQDKLLTLSTCTYKYGTYTQNSKQRYVVMARLVQEGEPFQQEAEVKQNPNPKQPQF